MIKIIKDLLREKGISGLYRGISANLCRDVGFSLIFFPVFAELNELGPKKQDGSSKFLNKLCNKLNYVKF